MSAWTGGVRVIILNEENKVLLVEQHHEGRDIWMVPGGAIEDNESSQDAAIREVMEETGLIVHIKKLLWHVEEVSEKRGQRFVNFFLGSVIGGQPELGSDPEFGEDNQVLRDLRFFSREELNGIENLYPEYLRDEMWEVLAGENAGDVYKVRT